MADLRTIASAPTYFLLAETEKHELYYVETSWAHAGDSAADDIASGVYPHEIVGVFKAQGRNWHDVTQIVAYRVMQIVEDRIKSGGSDYVPEFLRTASPDDYEHLKHLTKPEYVRRGEAAENRAERAREVA